MIIIQVSKKMETANCYQCGFQYSRKHLSKVEDKLKKNALSFKNAFVNENNEFLKPKFCRECRNIWLKLETKRGDNIQKYIVYLKRERQTNTEKHDTLVDDDHLPLVGSLGEKRKITITHYSYEKKEKKNATVELDTENLRTEIQEPFKNDIEEVKIDLNITVNDELLPSTGLVEENSETENKDEKLLEPNDEQTFTSRKFEENFTSDEHEETSALDDDSIVLPNNVKSNENENNVELGGDYEHWLNLWREMFCSEGWEGNPEGRLKYKYIMKKVGEAKKNGFAKEEKKDYNYWWELWREKFAGDKSGDKFLEEVKFIVQKMKDTKQENK